MADKTESIDFEKADYEYFLWLAQELRLAYNAVPLQNGLWRITVAAHQFHLIKDIGKGLKSEKKVLTADQMEAELSELIGWLERHRPKTGPYEIHSIGRSMAKIAHRGTAVYCFVAVTDGQNKNLGSYKQGQIFKPASWAAPAKHARGHLLESETWAKCFGEWGVRYLN